MRSSACAERLISTISYLPIFEKEQAAARGALEIDEVNKVLGEYQAQLSAIAHLQKEIDQVTATARAMRANIATLEAAIRHHLKAAEDLNRDMASYLGRDELRFIAHDTGYTITRNGVPALNLSEGGNGQQSPSFTFFEIARRYRL
ncbi:AAA family ATPase [Undibacterium arcticum]